MRVDERGMRADGQDPGPSLDAIAAVGTLAELAGVLRDLRRRQARDRNLPPLSYRDLAERTGWSHGIVGGYLSGQVLPPTDRFDILVRLLGATTAQRRVLAAARDRVEELRRATARPPRPRPEPALPRQLPADLATFTGRTTALADLDRLLETPGGTGRAVVISGTAGVGKTTLAVHWAHRIADRFPGGQLYANLRGFGPEAAPVPAAETVRGFLDAFDVPAEHVPATVTAQTALYRSLLATRAVLVVLDNATSVEQVRPLLPGAGAGLAVITSRNLLPGLVVVDGAEPLPLDLPGEEEAVAMLAGRLGAARLVAEPDATDRIVRLCARLPLALSIVAARAVLNPTFTLAALADELGGGLDTLHAGDPTTDLRAVLSWSYDRLPPAPARVFRLLGLHPGPEVGAAAVASLAGEPLSAIRRLLADLTRANLLSEPAPGRYTCHDLLRGYAAELVATRDSAADRPGATVRLLDHLLHTGHGGAQRLRPHRDRITLDPPAVGVTVTELPDRAAANGWFAHEHHTILAAQRRAAADGSDTVAWQLGWVLADYLDQQGHWHDALAAQELAVTAAERAGDRTGQAHSHRLLGRARIRLDRNDEARASLLRAGELYAVLGDRGNQADTYLALAGVAQVQGRLTDALADSHRALDIYRLGHVPAGQAAALNNIGWLHGELGQHREALDHCRQALAIRQELDDRAGDAMVLHSVGWCHFRLGDHAQAAAHYERALIAGSDLGPRFRAVMFDGLGDAHHGAGAPGPARAAWEQALALLTHIDHPDAAGVRDKLDAAG